jgi:antitoxin ParD1/3/4
MPAQISRILAESGLLAPGDASACFRALSRAAAGRSATINLRAGQKQEALTDRAAEALGRSALSRGWRILANIANDGRISLRPEVQEGAPQMPTRNVNLTDELDRFVLKKVESGRYENASEVVRAALRTLEREEQQYEVKLAALRAAIDDGDASGLAEGNVFARVRETLNLPTTPR